MIEPHIQPLRDTPLQRLRQLLVRARRPAARCLLDCMEKLVVLVAAEIGALEFYRFRGGDAADGVLDRRDALRLDYENLGVVGG
jgi:hypothetical protein